jgi:hypothetical protein
MVHASSSKKKTCASARIGGSIISGLAEIAIFHPVDTVAKRMMSYQKPIYFTTLNSVVFKEAAHSSVLTKWRSLFPGVGFGASYKVLQRTYKYAGQMYALDFIRSNDGGFFKRTFGERTGNNLQHAAAGSLVGMGEVALLPLDVLKIKAQTNPASLKGRGVAQLFRQEGLNLYRGGLWTMGRNAPGSFALFGGASTARGLMGVEEGTAPTWTQSFFSSIAGATASITVASPLDVVKTRIQNRSFDDPRGGVTIIRELLSREGPKAFFKGLTPKLLVVGPKLVFSFTVAQKMIAQLDGIICGKPLA